MKRTYIKPETEEIECSTVSIIAASPDVQWNTNTGGTDTKIDDTTEPDPEAAKAFNGFLADDWNVDFNYDY